MELKDYQQQVLQDLENFLALVNQKSSLAQAYAAFWATKDVPAKPPYQNLLPGVPNVCFKVPTGGGKTFMAAAAIAPIFAALPPRSSRVVVWLVPSDTILTQTRDALKNMEHPYRQRLQRDFSGRVEVYTKEELLQGQGFSPANLAEQLSVLVLSYDSFRATNKEGRKVYQENGNLQSFVPFFTEETELLAEVDETALIQVVRQYSPLVIVDESHHARSVLSVEMLKNFNPCFVLDLTATPKADSNIISYVPASKLKAADMVKLPVIVYNRQTQADVMEDALQLQRRLETIAGQEAMAGRVPLRPIVLFQAESKGKGDRATFDKIKADLIEKHGILPEQIAIKTADVNDLKQVPDLMAADCPIRYIITVNALKEGWDCPFAYILASLANRTSAVDVEQVLGRILRRPYTKKFSDSLLNMCYVFTSSVDFRLTLAGIIKGLNAAGFSDKEYRIGEDADVTDKNGQPKAQPQAQPLDFPALEVPSAASSSASAVSDVNVNAGGVTSTRPEDETRSVYGSPAEAGVALAPAPALPAEDPLDPVLAAARAQSEAYEKELGQEPGEERAPEEKEKMTQFKMQPAFRDAKVLRLPQFFIKADCGGLFGGEEERKLSKENLWREFSLRDKDTEIDFTHLDDMFEVDLYGTDDYPRYKKLTEAESRFIKEHFAKFPKESKIQQCTEKIHSAIDRKKDAIASQDIKQYIKRIVETFDHDQLDHAAQNTGAYIRKINEKLDQLLADHAKKVFMQWIHAKKIICKPNYQLPLEISPLAFSKNIVKSLYEAEEDNLNGFEHRVITEVASLDNVCWWHRIKERKGFGINGYINHYPDFMVMTKSGVLALLETKGDDRDNSDSMQKLDLGKIWQAKAGDETYSYFMIFDKKPLPGAHSFDAFMDIMKTL